MEFKIEQQHWDSLELLYKKFQVPDFLPGTVYTVHSIHRGMPGYQIGQYFLLSSPPHQRAQVLR